MLFSPRLIVSKRVLIIGTFISCCLFSCNKMENTDAKAGELPTNYISILDSAFLPNNLAVIAGSSITFVNNTSSDKSITSSDSVTIKAVTVKANDSYVFKKDTVGFFTFHLIDKKSVMGSFSLLP